MVEHIRPPVRGLFLNTEPSHEGNMATDSRTMLPPSPNGTQAISPHLRPNGSPYRAVLEQADAVQTRVGHPLTNLSPPRMQINQRSRDRLSTSIQPNQVRDLDPRLTAQAANATRVNARPHFSGHGPVDKVVRLPDGVCIINSL